MRLDLYQSETARIAQPNLMSFIVAAQDQFVVDS